MGDRSAIEWTATRHADGTITPGSTWNPLRGCTKVSEGCTNCYAMSVAYRFSGPGQPYEGLAKKVNGKPAWTNRIALVREHLHDPLRWSRPRRVFVNSMSDLAHKDVPDDYITEIFAIMALAPQHTYQVLTKRPERLAAWINGPGAEATRAHVHDRIDTATRQKTADTAAIRHTLAGLVPQLGVVSGLNTVVDALTIWPLRQVWIGTSVENQETATERIPHLEKTLAAVHFLSCEPLLGPLDLRPWLPTWSDGHIVHRPIIRSSWLNWVIVGGESGPNARPMHPDWARTLRDQCLAAGIPFFFKQHGEWAPVVPRPTAEELRAMTRAQKARQCEIHNLGSWSRFPDWEAREGNQVMQRVGKHNAGRLLDGREWNEMPT